MENIGTDIIVTSFTHSLFLFPVPRYPVHRVSGIWKPLFCYHILLYNFFSLANGNRIMTSDMSWICDNVAPVPCQDVRCLYTIITNKPKHTYWMVSLEFFSQYRKVQNNLCCLQKRLPYKRLIARKFGHVCLCTLINVKH